MSDIDKFELLSAYLDGEVTQDQKQQVQDWLDKDPEFRAVYQKLLKLQRSCANLAYPPTPVSADQVQVKLQKRLQQQQRKGWLIGGAIAAAAVAALASLFPTAPEYPMVALNRPTVAIAAQLSIPLNRPLVVIPYEIY